ELHESAIDIEEQYVDIDPAWSGFFAQKERDHYQWMTTLLSELMNQQDTLSVQLNHRLCEFGQFLYSQEASDFAKTDPLLAQYLEEIKEPHQKLHDSAGQIQKIISGESEDKYDQAFEYYKMHTQPNMDAVKTSIGKLILRIDELIDSYNEAVNIYNNQTSEALEQVKGYLDDIVDTTKRNVMTDEVMLNLANQSQTILIVFSLIAIGVGIFLAIVIARSISKSLEKVIDNLSDSSAQVTQASQELSSASQQLAEGSSEQASSLEETSATLNQSSSMLQRTSENTGEATKISESATNSSQKGQQQMEKMMDAMQKLSDSSTEISKIINVIDSIAFQTNILSLNAAVEAARAGEAGAGFAVVAEEVRNLAQKSANAANDTKDIIEKNIVLSKEGVEVARMVSEALNDINSQSGKLNQLIEQINEASTEQTQGIQQINEALNQMEQVTQQNAANAEETASSSEELNAQAETLNNIIEELTRLVEGASSNRSTDSYNNSTGS
ncbi:MAG: methyl-accepting chemotaxis protein, partial [Thermotogota bacterium]